MSDFYCEQVLSGKILVDKIEETEQVLAFRHTRPAYPVHIVVIPKAHIASLLDLEEGDLALVNDMLRVIKRVAAQVMLEYGACRVITNLGSYQDSKHLHWHVVFGALLPRR